MRRFKTISTQKEYGQHWKHQGMYLLPLIQFLNLYNSSWREQQYIKGSNYKKLIGNYLRRQAWAWKAYFFLYSCEKLKSLYSLSLNVTTQAGATVLMFFALPFFLFSNGPPCIYRIKTGQSVFRTFGQYILYEIKGLMNSVKSEL